MTHRTNKRIYPPEIELKYTKIKIIPETKQMKKDPETKNSSEEQERDKKFIKRRNSD